MPSSADWLTFGSQCTARLGSFRACLRLIIEPRSHLPPAHPGQFSNELARPYSLWGSSGLQAHRPTIFHGIQARGPPIPASHSFPLPFFLQPSIVHMSSELEFALCDDRRSPTSTSGDTAYWMTILGYPPSPQPVQNSSASEANLDANQDRCAFLTLVSLDG